MEYIYNATVSRVVDGDTVDLFVDLGFYAYKIVRVRLASVDAPEIKGVDEESSEFKLGQRCKEVVQEWLDEFNADGLVVETRRMRGSFDQWEGRVWPRGADPENTLNRAVVRFLDDEGWYSGE